MDVRSLSVWITLLDDDVDLSDILSHLEAYPPELASSSSQRNTMFVTSQHVLYYCTYYSVSFTCTVHCTYYTYCTLYMFSVSLFPMLKFHLQHLFTLLFTLRNVHF